MAITLANTSASLSGKTVPVLDGTHTITGVWTFSGIANTGLAILDTNASHALSIVPGSDLTAARTLTLITGDASRTLTISADSSLNQSLLTSASPTFAGLTCAGTLNLTSGTLNMASAALGTGTVAGRSIIIGRNSSGNGAAGAIFLTNLSGTTFALWVDATGDLRIHSTAPLEDGSVSDTAGTVVGTQS